MTLLSHPQVREAFGMAASIRHDLPAKEYNALWDSAEQALLTAILTALQEGNGLDFEAASKESYEPPTRGEAMAGITDSFNPAKYEAALDRQHRAIVGALREQVERWKSQFAHEREANDGITQRTHTAEREVAALRTENARLTARVQQLRDAMRITHQTEAP